MLIRDILKQSMVLPGMHSEEKLDALLEVATRLATQEELIGTSPSLIFDSVLQREQMGSTGVGDGVAIPHAKVPGLSSIVGAFGTSYKGISYDTIDDKPVRLIFMLLVPERSGGLHLKALARIARLLKKEQFRDEILDLTDAESIHAAFVQQDSKI